MRDVPAGILSNLQQNHGSEPLLIVEVQWVDGGDKVLYSDQKLSGLDYPYPNIIQVGNFDMATMVTGSSDSQSISLTLDDVDGELKAMLDVHDIHKRPVWVYQGFQDLTVAHKFLLFKGEITSPILWSEGDRILTFDVLTRREDNEVAFSMEEGDFDNIPDEARGKVWPLVFGEVCNMQAVQVRAPLRGIITHGEGISDFTIPERICQARYIQCPSVSAGEETTLSTDGAGTYTESTQQTYGPELECVQNRYETICNLEFLLEQQQSYEHATLDIRGGQNFPQEINVTLNINGGKFQGHFSGNTFTVTQRIHPEFDNMERQLCAPVPDRSIGLAPTQWTSGWTESETGTAWYFDVNSYTDDCDPDNPIFRQVYEGGPTASQKAFDDMETADFFWIPPGTDVFLEEKAEILYIVSLLPGTINNVAAYKRQPTGRSLLLEVPSEYYIVYETDYDGYTVVEIGLEKKLSLFDSDWHDDLYVSFTSDIGPNPVDIIQWLVEKYTSLTVDSTTFTDIQSKMTNYPTNFWIKERMNILQLIQDIAYQTRCAVYIRNDVVYIKYLSEEPTSVRTITGSDILVGTFNVSHTTTEDIATKHTVKWQNGEAGVENDDVVENTIVLKYNVPKYGVQEADHVYYTQNTFDTILKSATFWLIRDSHTWKQVSFSTTIKHLDLDLFDCIMLDLSQFSLTPVKCVITKAEFNNENNTIDFEAWTPIRAGTDAPYYWAWPAGQAALARWPLPGEEDNADPGYDFNVSPPTDHILSGGDAALDDSFVVFTSGDNNPSDLDDIVPTLFCQISDFVDTAEDEPEFQALEIAKMARRQQMDNALNKDVPAAGNDSDKKKRRTACGEPQYGDGCVYEVTIFYVTPVPPGVTSGKILGGCIGGPCWCSDGGTPCTSTMNAFCHTFGAPWGAWMFYQSKLAEIKDLTKNCGYFCNQSAPWMARAPKAVPDPEHPEECEEFPGDPDAPNQGEIYEPKDAG
ncbi:MAG: hypothetical protein ACYTBX_12600 [Planctomycetota bacterium]|jgi:hypothetical protein